MSAKNTFAWVLLAAALFGFIFFFQRHTHKPAPGPMRVLPNLKAALVTSVQVRPAGVGQLQIRVERTNQTWRLVEPVDYPAQTRNIEQLIAFLERLTPAVYMNAAEVRSRPSADEEYGFATPQASLFVQEGSLRSQLLVGARTAPGDQVFLQVVGDQGVYVIDAELLKFLPRSADDWRDTTLVEMDPVALDRIAVTNNGKAFVLQREATNHLWQMIWPLGQSRAARADNNRIEDSLRTLLALHIEQFVSNEPKDLESYGLASPTLEIALGQSTNVPVLLQFGKTVDSNTNLVYARRVGQTPVFSLRYGPLLTWRSRYELFRDPHLFTLTEPVESVEVHGLDSFVVRHETNDAWTVVPEGSPAFPGDTAQIKKLIESLVDLQIIDFVKDVVNAPDLPEYGLATPARSYILRGACSPSNSAMTNPVLAELNFGFGTNKVATVYARRTDETSVYAVRTNDFALLPAASWQLRQRRVWQFSETNVIGVTIQQNNKTRKLLRRGPHEWSLAPGSQGIIDDLAVDATVQGLAQTSANAWVARGDYNRAAYGFGQAPYQVTLELQNGETAMIEFGGEAPTSDVYACVKFEGQPWLLEFPWILFRDVSTYLSIPANL
jgi:hypothetical protein